jgi:hypothetical protein
MSKYKVCKEIKADFNQMSQKDCNFAANYIRILRHKRIDLS